MKKYIAYFSIAALCLALSSCGGWSEYDNAPGGITKGSIELLEGSTQYIYDEVEGQLVVETTSDLKSVVSDQDWCEVSFRGTTITVKLEENTEYTSRTAKVTITNTEGATLVLDIYQKGAKYQFAGEDINFAADGGDIEVEYNFIDKMIVKIPDDAKDWLSVDIDSDAFTLTAEANDAIEGREATVVYAISSETGTFTVSQDANEPYLKDFDTSDIDVTYEETEKSITYKTNSTLEVSVEAEEEFVTAVAEDGTLTISIERNYLESERTAQVNYSVPDSDISGSISITQGEAPFTERVIVFKDADGNEFTSLTLDGAAVDSTVVISTNTNWTVVSSDDSWLTIDNASYTFPNAIPKPVDESFVISVTKNTKAAERSATLTFTGDNMDADVVLTVTQGPGWELNSNWTISYEGGTKVDGWTSDDFMVTVGSEDTGSYAIAVIPAEDFTASGLDQETFVADTIYPSISGETVNSGTAHKYFYPRLENGDYIAYAVGVDSEGNKTGYYQYAQFTLSRTKTAYEMLVGTYTVDRDGTGAYTDTWVIEPVTEDAELTLTGPCGSDALEMVLSLEYDPSYEVAFLGNGQTAAVGSYTATLMGMVVYDETLYRINGGYDICYLMPYTDTQTYVGPMSININFGDGVQAYDLYGMRVYAVQNGSYYTWSIITMQTLPAMLTRVSDEPATSSVRRPSYQRANVPVPFKVDDKSAAAVSSNRASFHK